MPPASFTRGSKRGSRFEIKNACQSRCIVLLFGLLFLGVQEEILRHKFDRRESMELRYDPYLDEPENTIDVLFLGSSPTCHGAFPLLMWKECGFTSFNMSMPQMSALITYYQLGYALETQKLKLVVLDLTRICVNGRADESIMFECQRRDERQSNAWRVASAGI